MQALDLTPFCKTQAEARDFSSRLGTLTSDIFHTGFILEKALADEFGIQKRDKLLALMRESQIPTSSQSALKDFFIKLQETVNAMPVLTLAIAFEPKESTLKNISEWFMLNIGKQILFDITVDPNLIAGATITYNGQFKDFSLKQAFQIILDASITPPKAVDASNQQEVHRSGEHLHVGR